MRTSKRKTQLARIHMIQEDKNKLLLMNQTNEVKLEISKIDSETDFLLNKLENNR